MMLPFRLLPLDKFRPLLDRPILVRLLPLLRTVVLLMKIGPSTQLTLARMKVTQAHLV